MAESFMQSLELDNAVPRLLLNEVIQKVRYEVKEVAEVEIDPARPTEVRYTLRPGADDAQARLRLIVVVDEACKGYRGIPVKRLWENKREHKRVAGVSKLLVERGEMFTEGPGQVVLTGQALQLLEWFDRVFAGWAAEHGFAPQNYPVLIPTAVLDRAEYFNSFPQYLTFASHFPEDSAHIKTHIDAFKSAPAGGIHGLANAQQVLSPAVCYHLYPQVADKALGKANVKVTARGRCFRYETVNMTPLERQWDFSMRELIFVGSAEATEKFRRQFIGLAEELVERLQLDGFIESAHDPFFTAESEGKLVLQRLKHLKYELRLSLEEEDKSSAVASFNNHEDFFGRAFGVKLAGGEVAHSGCAAFGLERWLNAFLCQHGLDRAAWPRPVMDAMERADARWLERGSKGEDRGDDRGERPRYGDRDERPRYGDRGDRYRDDRPPRRFDRDDGPPRRFDRDSGPPRDRDSGPPRDRDSGPPRDRDSGPPRDRDSGPPRDGDAPRRPFRDRPPRRDGGEGFRDRPPPREGGGDDRPPRPFGDRPPPRRDGPPSRGPRPPFGDRDSGPPRGPGGPRRGPPRGGPPRGPGGPQRGPPRGPGGPRRGPPRGQE